MTHTRQTLTTLAIVLALTGVCAAGITPEIERTFLDRNWQEGFAKIAADKANIQDPVARMLSALSCIAINRNNGAWILLHATMEKEHATAWFEYAGDLLKRHPDHPVALFLAGDAAVRFSRFTGPLADSMLVAAQGLYTRAIGLDSTFAMAWFGRGCVCMHRLDHEGAYNDLVQAVRLQPDFAEALFYLASNEEKQKKYEDAISLYTRAHEASSSFSYALAYRGAVYRQQGQFDSALADCEAALTEDSLCVIAHFIKAQSLEDMGKAPEAIAAYELFISKRTSRWDRQAAAAQRSIQKLKDQ